MGIRGVTSGVLGVAAGLIIGRAAGPARRRRTGPDWGSAEDLRLLLDSTEEGIYGLDSVGRCTFVNRPALRLLGYGDPALLLGRRMHEAIHHSREEGTPYLWDACPMCQVVRAAHGIALAEDIFWRPEGTSFPVQYSALPVTRDGVRPAGAVVTFVDITERRRAQERAEEARQERTRLAALNAEIGLALTQADSLSELLGRCAAALVTHLEAAFARIWTLEEASQTLVLQASAGLYTHLDGGHARVRLGQHEIGRIAQERTAHLTNNVIDDPQITDHEWARREGLVAFAGYPLIVDDRPVGVMALFARRPLGEASLQALAAVAHGIGIGIVRKRAAQERQDAVLQLAQLYTESERARSMHQAVFDAASDGMVLIAPDGAVLAANRQFAESFRISEDDLPSAHLCTSLFPRMLQMFPEAQAIAESIGRALRDGGNPSQAAVVQTWPERRELDLTSRQVTAPSGEDLGRLFVFRDVTHQREVDRMKTEFISLVSHELRTPLTSICGYTDLILEGDAGDVPQEQREYLDIIKQNADRLVALINQLLDISRIEAGRVEIDRHPFDVAAAVRLVAASLAPQIAAKSQTLVLELPEDLPAVLGDRDRIIQVVTNLLTNAHKYTPEQGHIRVQAARAGEQVRVAVTDSGIGVAPEDVPKLFDKFYRVNNTLTREVGGTGLGLAIVKSIVELHGGVVTVQSRPGEGSTFAFTLSLAEPGASTTAIQPRLGMTRRAAILVVEDDRDTALLIRRHLEKAGYHVEVAESAEEALVRVTAAPPDLITLDIRLPGIDGFALVEQLRQMPPAARIPILVVSIVHDDERGTRLGLLRTMPKPFDEQQLIGSVDRLLALAHRRRLLIVDDDPHVLGLLTAVLSKAGFEVRTAANGPHAIEAARREAPGLILLDLRMAGLDGFSVLRALKADAATADVPVVVMTGSEGLKAARTRVLTLGASEFITKPFRLGRLVNVVRTLTEKGA